LLLGIASASADASDPLAVAHGTSTSPCEYARSGAPLFDTVMPAGSPRARDADNSVASAAGEMGRWCAFDLWRFAPAAVYAPNDKRAEPVGTAGVPIAAAPIGVFKARAGTADSSAPQYRFNPTWALRSGVIVDSASTAALEPASADAPRHWVSAGLGFRPDDRWNIELGYAHVFNSDTRIDDFGSAGALVGRFTNGGNLLGVSGRVSF
jgi:hypothetical protein